MRRTKDKIDRCCYNSVLACEKMVPTDVSEDMRMERVRPMKAETKTIIFVLFSILVIVVLFLRATVEITQVALSWESGVTCEVLDIAG